MVSPVYQIPLYCSSYVFKFPLLRIKLLFPKSLMSISFTKNKGSCGQVRFALLYPISIYELFLYFFLTPLPNEPNTSSFYLYYLDLSCSAIPIQPNKHLHLITSLKSILESKQDIPLKKNNLRDPSLRTGGLDPRTLNIGSDVVLYFG